MSHILRLKKFLDPTMLLSVGCDEILEIIEQAREKRCKIFQTILKTFCSEWGELE